MGICCSVDASCVKNNFPDQAADVTSRRPEKKEVSQNKDIKTNEATAFSYNTSKAVHEIIPFPNNGINLSYLLNEFVDECGGREALEGLTTTDVCEKFVKPLTKDYELSYCDMILEKAKESDTSELDGVVKTATVFISHAWKYKFLDVLSALEDHFTDEPDKIVWFDIVSNNQHKATELEYGWWATTFKGAIKQLGHTVMVIAPWNDPIPYKRAWCIFEAYCTNTTGAKFEIAMSNNERKAFVDECKHGPTDVINKMLSIVNAKKSEAWNPDDKERIHSVIKNEVGFAKINSMVFQQLRDWVLKVALAELNAVTIDTIDEVELMNLVEALYTDQGKYDKAEPFHTECQAKRKTILGSDDPNTLKSINTLASLYQRQGKYDMAVPLYKECLLKRKTILGLDHPDTLTSMDYLAGLYSNQGNYNDAEQLYKECLAKRKTILGSDDPNTLKSINNLAGLYVRKGEYDMAVPLYKECLAKCKEILGTDHPQTLISINNLAGLYLKQGKYDTAEALYKECLAKRKTILGSEHPCAVNTIENLAGLYLKQGKYDEFDTLCAKYETRMCGSQDEYSEDESMLETMYCKPLGLGLR